MTNLLSTLILVKMAKLKARSEASRQNILNSIIDAKLCFALLASLRSAIFIKNQVDNQLVILSAEVKVIFTV